MAKITKLLAAAAFTAAAGSWLREAHGASSGLSTADIADEVAQHIEIRENPSVFAVFAMLNAAGYDEETHADLHPTRKSVRRTLSRRLAEAEFARAQEYVGSHTPLTDLRAYAVAAVASTGSPNFAPGPSWPQAAKDPHVAKLADLAVEMRAFLRALPIDSVYKTVAGAYQEYITDYQLAVRREVALAVRYARVRERRELTGFGEHPRTTVIPNLLLAYDASSSFSVDTMFYTIEGPRAIATFNPHEFVHAITHAFVYDTAKNGIAERKASAAFASAKSHADIAALPSLAAYVDENLVRAIVLRYGGLRDETRIAQQKVAAEREAAKGYLLVPYLFGQLARYEEQSAPLREFFPGIFDQYTGGK